MPNKRGFTIVEILTVLVIVAIVLTIVAFGARGARSSARDERRRADLASIASSLEKYRSDCGFFPTTSIYNAVPAGSSLRGDGSTPACLNNNIYLSNKPGDLDASKSYSYTSTGQSFVLCTSLETALPGMQTTGCGSCGSTACNYSVRSQ